jgi:L-threonylcarbamoyladenylate synthase
VTDQPRLLAVDPAHPDPDVLAAAAVVLRGGGLVAFPTETVYGLGADALSEAAVRRIYGAKGRPGDNPLIVHVDSLEAASKVAAWIPPLARQLAEQWWPGPLTLVLEADPSVPAITTGGLATVALRVPSHPVALALLHAAAVPIAAPSANRSGRPSPTSAQHVLDDLGDMVDLIIDGGTCGVGLESTVVDARGETPTVLREGAVTREQLGLGSLHTRQPEGDPSLSPGTRYRHYAPSCDVEIVATGDGAARAAAIAGTGRRVGLIGFSRAAPPVHTLAQVRDADAMARCLYSALRAAESAGLDIVVVEAVAEVGIGRAVMDRLRRAAGG